MVCNMHYCINAATCDLVNKVWLNKPSISCNCSRVLCGVVELSWVKWFCFCVVHFCSSHPSSYPTSLSRNLEIAECWSERAIDNYQVKGNNESILWLDNDIQLKLNTHCWVLKIRSAEDLKQETHIYIHNPLDGGGTRSISDMP